MTTAGNGAGVKNGTSPKIVALSEMVGRTDMAASDKIGMAIKGEFVAIDTAIAENTLEIESPKIVAVSEKLSEYLSVKVTAAHVNDRYTTGDVAIEPNVAMGNGSIVKAGLESAHGGNHRHTL